MTARCVVLVCAAALCSFAQFRTIEMTFKGVGCASCIESLPGRVQRLRGVESATVDAGTGVLRVKLAEQNRVRVEQIRDFVEQDGTKAASAVVSATGEIREEGGRRVIQIGSSTYVVTNTALAGVQTIAGEIVDLKPESGAITIRIR